jgi:hypothetical protein
MSAGMSAGMSMTQRRSLRFVAALACLVTFGFLCARHGRSATGDTPAIVLPDTPLPALSAVGNTGTTGYALVLEGTNAALYEARVNLAAHGGSLVKTALATNANRQVQRENASAWDSPLLEAAAAGQQGAANAGAMPNAGVMPDSAPLFVSHPGPLPKPDGDLRFFTAYGTRPDAVYVHTDDGAIHALRADNGSTLFRYLPKAVPVKNNAATSPRQLTIALASGDVAVSGAWKTVLAGGMGGSAQGVVALDVSDPASFSTRNVLFEFTEKDDSGIGNLAAAPQFARFRTIAPDGIVGLSNLLVVPGGYNAYARDGKNDTSARGRLFLLRLDKPAGDAWDRQGNFFRLSTDLAVSGAPNALGPPAMLTGPDGAVRIAWAGDLQGNVWRFDFSSH